IANLSRCCSPPEHFPTRRSAIWVIPARSSTSAAGLRCANRLAVYCTVSLTVRSFSSPPVCITAETRPRVTACRGCMPKTSACPDVCRDKPRMMSMVDVLPAPLGPSIATISPDAMLTSTSLTACTCPKCFLTSFSSTASGTAPVIAQVSQPGLAAAFAAPPPWGERARAHLAQCGDPDRHEQHNDDDNQLNAHPGTSWRAELLRRGVGSV